MVESGKPATEPLPTAQRVRASGPILILAALFLVATFLAWYFTWFGRGLSDGDISQYLADTRNPRHVQHALLQVQQRLERGDPSARQWYLAVIALSGNQETEFRLTTAWLMGFDNQSEEFHDALLKLVKDDAPIVRRNAALALVRFNDNTGRDVLVSILRPYELKSVASGMVSSTLHTGSEVSRGALLARIEQTDGKVVELRSPLPGGIGEISRGNGSQVSVGEVILQLNSDDASVYEALRGLSFVGTQEDLALVESFANSSNASDRVREQAKLTAKAIATRGK